MEYRNYIIAAYAVFFIVLAWDFIVSRLQIRRELRIARLRASRGATRNADRDSDRGELSR